MASPLADRPPLVEVVPPRDLEGGMRAARGMLGALAGEPVVLEVLVTADGPRWLLRAATADVLAHLTVQVRAAHPRAVVSAVERDPLALAPGEHAAVVTMQPASAAALPLRAEWRLERDPLLGVVAAVSPVSEDRVLLQLALGPVRRNEGDRIRAREERPTTPRYEGSGSAASPIPFVLLGGAAAAGLQGWQWYEAGEWGLLAGAAGVGAVGIPAAGALAARLWRRDPTLPRAVVATKLAGPLMAARLSVFGIAQDETGARALAVDAGRAFAAYDDPSGGGLRGGRPRRGLARPRRAGLLLNAAEAAALWHLPDAIDGPTVRRTTAQRIAPVPGHAERGVLVGTAPAAHGRPVALPEPLLARNHLVVAKTRRGKSTLLRHIAAGVMERMAAGEDDAALVVVDPHQDLAEAVLASVPDAIADRTVYLDFARAEHPIGLNLLDVTLFPDRDRTVEGIVTMMSRLWPSNWGPRMEGALRAALASLHEVNRGRAREKQYTLLDVAPFLTNSHLRSALLRRIDDPAVKAWWRDNYAFPGQALQQQIATPVTSKIGRFLLTEASRLVFGQPVSTFNPRDILRHGGVLVINTSVGTLGEGASALVGATALNLLALLVEEQVGLPPEERRRVIQLIDESSTLGAVDYPRALSELGKYGASYTLVTQSLAKLDAVDRDLAPTILANCDGLTAFQCSADDARRLIPELGGGLEVEDLVSLDDYTCYARWYDGFARPPAFTLGVAPPPPLDRARATAIAQRSAARFGRPRETVAREVQLMLEDRQDHADRLKAKADEQSEKASTRTGRGTAPSDHQNEATTTDETV